MEPCTDPTPSRRARGCHLARAAGVLLAVSVHVQAAEPNQGSFISLYGARHSPDRLVDIVRLRASTTDDAWLTAVAWGEPLLRWGPSRLELEGQLVNHHGQQDHWELNAVLVLRWTDLPWDSYMDTSIALGEGLSYASEVPPLEPRGDIDNEEESSRWLNYLLVEAELMLPRSEDWAAFIRVHHRSGIFGAFGDVEGGSNFVGLGIRHYFD